MRRELLKKRVGSKVTVAPPRPPSEEIDVAVSSQITVKPRPKVPADKQASKMLLLRAMAEAQQSTVLARKRPRSPVPLASRSKRGARGNIVIEVASTAEYVPTPIGLTTRAKADEYVPAAGGQGLDNTQFVVTLTGVEKMNKNRRGQKGGEDETKVATNTAETTSQEDEEREAREAVQKTIDEKPRRPVKERIGFRMRVEEDEQTKLRRKERFDRLYERKESPRRSRSRSPPAYRSNRGRDSGYDDDRRRDRDRRYENSRRDSGRRDYDRRRDDRDSPRYESSRRSGRDREEDDDGFHTGRQNNNFYKNSGGSGGMHPKVQELVERDNESRHSGTPHSNTPPIHRRHRARTISPINFDLTDEETRSHDSDDDFENRVNKENEGDKRPPQPQVKKLESTKKFDNVPSCK